MMVKLCKIDDISRLDHFYLETNDNRYYFHEYFSGKGFTYSKSNSFIYNLKKGPDNVNSCYRQKAIQESILSINNEASIAGLFLARRAIA